MPRYNYRDILRNVLEGIDMDAKHGIIFLLEMSSLFIRFVNPDTQGVITFFLNLVILISLPSCGWYRAYIRGRYNLRKPLS